MKSALSLLLILTSITCYAQKSTCLEQSKEYFSDKNYPAAETLLQKCAVSEPSNPDILISLAGIEMLLGKFDNAATHFSASLRFLDTKSPYQAYVNSRLGDIAMHKADLQKAAMYYDTALHYEPANVNALVGRGVCEERAGRRDQAAVLFKKALAVDFTNIVARERLIAMEPFILTDEELLLALKERNIIDPVAQSFTEEDRLLFNKIHRAEANSGIEFLSSKFENKIPPGLIVERDSNKLYVRKMLTLTGYNELIAQFSKDAKQLFLTKGIAPGTVFELKDFDGNKIFDNSGNLTDEGLVVYAKVLKGYKAYLRPNEAVPQSPSQVDALAKRYIAQGYSEISMPEFLYLMRHTRCTEQTLVKDLRVRVINIDARNKRVFVISGPKATEPLNLPYQYVSDYRQGRGSQKNSQPVYRSTFGSGAREDFQLCKEDGTLFTINDVGRR